MYYINEQHDYCITYIFHLQEEFLFALLMQLVTYAFLTPPLQCNSCLHLTIS